MVGAESTFKLEKYQETINWCEEGLKVHACSEVERGNEGGRGREGEGREGGRGEGGREGE